MVVWVPKYSRNSERFVVCPQCGTFITLYKYIFNRDHVNGITRLFIDTLYVANMHQVLDDRFACICGTSIGVAVNLGIRLDQYSIVSPLATEDEDGLAHELELRLSPGDDPEFVWGCSNCRRPIGYGGEFLTRIVRPLELLNVEYLQNVPSDDVYFLEDGLRIVCRCGSYVGYLDTVGRVLLGLFISLNDSYYG